MPQKQWSAKRERQYEHIKDSAKEGGASRSARRRSRRGRSTRSARAAARRRHRSRSSREDISSGRRGGLRSGRSGPRGQTKEQLYNEAKRRGIKGRSKMNKAQLLAAVNRKKS